MEKLEMKVLENLKSFDIFVANMNESEVNEAKKYTLDQVLTKVDASSLDVVETGLLEPLGKAIKGFDTPGGYSEEYDDYDDIKDYMIQNMGSKMYKELADAINFGIKSKPDVIEKFMKGK